MSLIIMILLIGLLILVHELGHLGAALFFKVKVSKFGIGLPIGPTLYERQVGPIKLVIHAFLFGGYVMFPDDEEDSEIPEDSEHRLMNKPIWQRAIIFSAGVIANVICAYVLVVITALCWGNLPSGYFDTYAEKITAEKTQSIWQSGIQKGDKFVEINGSPINRKYALNLFSIYSASFNGKTTKELVEDNYKKLKAINPAFKDNEIIEKGLVVKIPNNLEKEKMVELTPNMLNAVELYRPQEVKLSDKQIKLRDEIKDKKFIESDGTITLDDISYALSDTKKPLYIKVLRDGKIVALNPVYSNSEGQIGIQYYQKENLVRTKGLKVITQSYTYLYNETKSMLIGLKQLFTGKIPVKNLHGVILITKMGGDIITHNGIFYGLLLTAIISMNLAILNILPIPALDGGHLAFLLIEKIKGKPLNKEIMEKILTVFFLLLVAFLILVLFNDIYVLVKPLFIK